MSLRNARTSSMICDVVVSRMMNSNLLSRLRSTTLTKASTEKA